MYLKWMKNITKAPRILFWSLTLLCVSSQTAFASPTLLDFGLDSIYEDNLSRTPDAMGSGVDGLSTRAFASARKGYVLTEDLSFMMKVGASYKNQHIDESADYISGNLVFASTYSPFDSFSAPVFKTSLDIKAKNYLNDFGSEQIYRAKLSAHSQLTDVINVHLGVARRIGESEWATIDTINIESWDTDRTEYFLGLDFDFDSFTLYSKLSQAEGELIWTRRMPGQNSQGYMGALWDNAKVRSLDLGVNYPLSDSSVLDLLARYSDVDRNGNDMYELNSVSMAYIKRLSF